ncbi:multiubiquitin domain-containing protein [Spirosoma linguale]
MSDSQSNRGNDVGRITPLAITFQTKKFTWLQQYATGAELKKLFGLKPEQELYQSLIDPWDDVLVANDESINLARPGAERFFIRQPLEFQLDDQKLAWDKPFITGLELRKVGRVEEGDEIWLSVARPYKDELITDSKRVDLTPDGIEKFFVVKLEVVIRINNVEHKIRRGTYTVTQLKKIGNVKASDEMDALEGHKLTPLDDAATVVIKGDEQFISHVRDGSSA